MLTIALSTSAILFILAGLHFYWALGGKMGFKAVLPQLEDGSPVFIPGKGAILFVGFSLVGIGALPLLLQDNNYFQIQWIQMLGWVFTFVFFLRALGDFRYMGFFKKVKGTKFAQYDTNLYSPLCLILSGSFFMLVY